MKKSYQKDLVEASDILVTQIKEDFLHYVWKFKLFKFQKFSSISGEPILVEKVGTHNKNSGPDFLNAKIVIANQLWAGNIEMHLKSSDWYAHKHENDSNYDAVILHVVWEYDVPVFRKDGNEIDTLELKTLVNPGTLKSYRELLFGKEKWILCEKDISKVNSFIMQSWMTRLYVERLEKKSAQIYELLKETSNDWEAVLFQLLAKNFGMKINGDAFLNLAKSLDFSIVRKLQNKEGSLEHALLGQAGFLEEKQEDIYFSIMKNEYEYLKHKFNLTPLFKGQFLFFRLRPANFPTIRISQLATLYENELNLFSKIMETNELQKFYELLSSKTSEYWKNHYVFGKEVKRQVKRTSNSFVNLILINTIIPIKYAYLKMQGKDVTEELMELLQLIQPEDNGVISAFSKIKVKAESAFESQALLQLKNEYCAKQKCLECAIGVKLIKS